MRRATAVLLAAGSGTRLGLGPKALLPFNGTTLVHHAASQLLRGGCANVIVVIGAGAAEVRKAPLPPGCTLVENPRWREGMSTSFAAGIAAAKGRKVLVALVDQPGMTSGLIECLLAAHQPGRITAAGYRPGLGVLGGHGLQRGNPVLFSAGHAARAADLATGDSGAREYLAAHPDVVDVVDVSHFTDGADIDTPEQLYLLGQPAPPPSGGDIPNASGQVDRIR
jgi:nicotine blue oxidoreductase